MQAAHARIVDLQIGAGSTADEDPAHLGETLILPPAFEHLGGEVEPILTPLPNPRESWSRTS